MERFPIVKVGEILIVTLQTDLHDQAALALQRDLLEKIAATPVKGVLIDISVVDIVDSFMGRVLSDTAAMANIMNAIVVLVGIQPSVAITLVELGLEFKQIFTALNADLGMKLLIRKIAQAGRTPKELKEYREGFVPVKGTAQNGG